MSFSVNPPSNVTPPKLKCVHFDTKNFRKGLPNCGQSALAGSPTPKTRDLQTERTLVDRNL